MFGLSPNNQFTMLYLKNRRLNMKQLLFHPEKFPYFKDKKRYALDIICSSYPVSNLQQFHTCF